MACILPSTAWPSLPPFVAFPPCPFPSLTYTSSLRPFPSTRPACAFSCPWSPTSPSLPTPRPPFPLTPSTPLPCTHNWPVLLIVCMLPLVPPNPSSPPLCLPTLTSCLRPLLPASCPWSNHRCWHPSPRTPRQHHRLRCGHCCRHCKPAAKLGRAMQGGTDGEERAPQVNVHHIIVTALETFVG